MNKHANILFIQTSIGGYGGGSKDAPSQVYYQQIYDLLTHSVFTLEEFRALGRQLEAIASQAYLGRQVHAVEEATRLMLALPTAIRLENIARHYQALCSWQRGDIDDARQSLERIVEEATPQYRAKALQVIGLTYQKRGEVDAALPFYVAAGKAAADCDLVTLAQSQQMISVVRSMNGDHAQALEHLEKQFPLVRAISKRYPAAYYTFLNHLAVELAEVGRFTEAEAALSIALTSPFAPAYPEWSETRDEIAAKSQVPSRSIVAINRAPKPDLAPQVVSQRNAKPVVRYVPGYQAGDKDFFQRSVLTIPATATITFNTVSILDRVLICIGPRAPPALY